MSDGRAVIAARPRRLLDAPPPSARDEQRLERLPGERGQRRRRRRRARRRSRSLAARRAAHDVERRLDARPAPERQGALPHEQLEAVDDRHAGRQRGGGERRRRAIGPVGEIGDGVHSLDHIGRHRERLERGDAADRRAVDEQPAAPVGHGRRGVDLAPRARAPRARRPGGRRPRARRATTVTRRVPARRSAEPAARALPPAPSTTARAGTAGERGDAARGRR